MSLAAEFPEQNPSAEDNMLERTHEVVARLDTTRGQYLEACDTYIAQPHDKHGTALESAKGVYRQAFTSFLDTVRLDMEPLQFAKQGYAFFIQEDGVRVNHLNALIGTDILERATLSDKLDQNAQELFEQINDGNTFKTLTFEQIIEHFVTGVEADTTKFMIAVAAKEAPRWQRVRQIVGQHALDVGKTAIGTAAGIALMRLVARRDR